MVPKHSPDLLLSLPHAMSEWHAREKRGVPADWFVGADPPGAKLGSGGGTAYLLQAAWQARAEGQPFGGWLRERPKLIVHGGGQSRRLPAYSVVGKPLIPVPVLRQSFGQRLDQTVLDMQADYYARLLAAAPDGVAAMITSGDLLLRFGEKLPPIPDADVIAVGMRAEPSVAQHFGVFFMSTAEPHALEFFLQKPSPERIRELAQEHPFLLDSGVWMLSARAVEVLMRRCGWEEDRGAFVGGQPARYEFYGEFGPALGRHPATPDPDVRPLTCAVVVLPRTEFYHMGTNRQLIEAVWALQNRRGEQAEVAIGRAHPDQITQNSRIEVPIRREPNHTLWVENSAIPATWGLADSHVLTGVPANDWNLELEPGVCLDFVPVGETDWCVRAYGMDDSFSGEAAREATTLFGQPSRAWFAARGVAFPSAQFPGEADIYDLPLFPILPLERIDGGFLRWLFASRPPMGEGHTERWLAAPRVSAREIASRANLARMLKQRDANRFQALTNLYANRESSVFYRLDLEATARDFAASGAALPERDPAADGPDACMHEWMWRAEVRRRRGEDDGAAAEERAFACLRDSLTERARNSPVAPRLDAYADQIVWARAPARWDLAGGWTDTPPYCLWHGGRVMNLAVDLNGQPPVQVFAKPCAEPVLVVRSIDLGVEERITSYEQLGAYARPGSQFALAKAALALAGFEPRFHAEGGFGTLEAQLQAFGGGVELSMLAAIPAGSGLGTSSILAAALLGALGSLCGLNWSTRDIIERTLALEQLLTTGGGWQDQVGGVLRGAKLAETAPGMNQMPVLRWLPEHLFAGERANRTILLYYTGITRMARGILQDIVRGMFLNSAERLAILRDIGQNAVFAADAVQRDDYGAVCEAVRRSWSLNRRLDEGTNPPVVQAILDPVQDYLAANKLLGAGGGGYMVMMAKDEEAASRIRRELAERRPNATARFVDYSVSTTGLEITRS